MGCCLERCRPGGGSGYEREWLPVNPDEWSVVYRGTDTHVYRVLQARAGLHGLVRARAGLSQGLNSQGHRG